MNDKRHSKVKASHLARDAYLYVRQATRCQPGQQADSLQPQYNLQQRAVALGWAAERVMVIDNDLGQSGASAADRQGFQELMRQIQRGGVGIVMAWEPSRLTRSGTDWDRLLDACAMSDTLLLDQERLYDPADSHDRILLGCDPMVHLSKTVELTSQPKEALV